MATMKSYTDLEQSKKLAEILPPESADMCYSNDGTAIKIDANPYTVRYSMWKDCVAEIIPCWSLAALLNYLREIDFFPNIEADEHGVVMNICYYDEKEAKPLAPVHDIVTEAETFIDACYEMILKLHEQEIL